MCTYVMSALADIVEHPRRGKESLSSYAGLQQVQCIMFSLNPYISKAADLGEYYYAAIS
jgi:hypothetical protein